VEAHFDSGESVTTPEIGRKVRQLDNDVQAIYEMISKIDKTQQGHTTRLNGIDTRLDGIDTHLEGIDTRLGGIDTRLGGIDTRVGAVETQLAGLATQVGGLTAQVGGLTAQVGELADSFTTMDGKLDEVLRRLAN
jgi:archaellum component FlaC